MFFVNALFVIKAKTLFFAIQLEISFEVHI